MLIFLIAEGQKPEVVLRPLEEVLLDYSKVLPRLKALQIIPWFKLVPDPEKFAAVVLDIASADRVCLSILAEAEADSTVEHRIKGQAFTDERLQEHYLNLLRNWLSPLSGNVGKKAVTAHDVTIHEQYEAVWKRYGLNPRELEQVAKLPFFTQRSNAGRRDRAQIYRNITEFARAIIGEITVWATRKIEKAIAYQLARSRGLADCQRRLLAQLVVQRVKLTCRSWEYIPYYLYGAAGDRVDEDFARVRVLGALHDALADGEDTAKLADKKHILGFTALGAEYARWRALPKVIRYQALISDFARIMPGGKINSDHVRIEASHKLLDGLKPGANSARGWPCKMVPHKHVNPHDPGRDFPHATGWVRNEYCPNVITSRLLLAPLYAGTSGHTQGRILAWAKLAEAANVPAHLIIPAGYIALWRLFYDKRVSGFHTPFETLQGAFVLPDVSVGIKGCRAFDNDAAWNMIVEHIGRGSDLKALWLHWRDTLGARGRSRIEILNLRLAEERVATMSADVGTVVPRWSLEDNPSRTGTEVATWTLERIERAQDRASLRLLQDAPPVVLTDKDLLQMAEMQELAASVPLPKDEDDWE